MSLLMVLEFYNDLHHYLQSLIILVLSVLCGFLIRYVVIRGYKFIARNTKDIIIQSSYDRLKGSWLLFIPLLIFLVLFPRQAYDPQQLQTINKILQTLIIISFSSLGIRAVYVLQDVLYDKYDITQKDNIKARKVRTQILFIRKLMIIIIIIVSLSVVLMNIESVRRYGTTLITSAGVMGIIIGFAAQRSIANLLAGLQIAFTQPIKIEDVVIVENEWGWVEEINLTYVVVKIWDLRRLVVPINYFIEKPFQNWTRTTADLLGTVFLYLDYNVPLEKLRAHFDKLLDQSPLWDQKAKVVQVTDSTERCMQVRFLMGARNSKEAFDLRCNIREGMIDFIQKNYPDSLPKVRADISGFQELKPNK